MDFSRKHTTALKEATQIFCLPSLLPLKKSQPSKGQGRYLGSVRQPWRLKYHKEFVPCFEGECTWVQSGFSRGGQTGRGKHSMVEWLITKTKALGAEPCLGHHTWYRTMFHMAAESQRASWPLATKMLMTYCYIHHTKTFPA